MDEKPQDLGSFEVLSRNELERVVGGEGLTMDPSTLQVAQQPDALVASSSAELADQQATIGMLNDVSVTLHETGMAVIRKIG
jgi:hypothetical protein